MDRVLALDEKTGNTLTAFLPATRVSRVPDDAPMPAALIAVWNGPRLLLVFDRFRRQWELPGGRIDPGETPYQAAVRELHEESGLRLPFLTLAGYARFRLTAPPRGEYAAIYTARAGAPHPDFVPNQEISAIRWWDTTTPPPRHTQIIDATLAQHAGLGPTGATARTGALPVSCSPATGPGVGGADEWTGFRRRRRSPTC